jgi:hypothetical protein
MRENLDIAAAHFDLEVRGQPIFGWRLRSISARTNGRSPSESMTALVMPSTLLSIIGKPCTAIARFAGVYSYLRPLRGLWAAW